MLHIYIDTSVFVRFYSYSSDALNEVEKLSALIVSDQVCSYTTDQTIDELYRNRDAEIAEAMKRVEGLPVSVELPRFAQELEEAKGLTSAMKQVKGAKNALVSKIRETLHSDSLKADSIIQEIFDGSTLIKRSRAIIEKAEYRVKVGNPPGKGSGIGDQINWECLLEEVPEGTELHLISLDGDYSAKGEKGRVSHFLSREWKKSKGAEITLYQGLGEFTKKHFPDIKVPSDAIKLSAIKKLTKAGTFSTTHEQIAILEGVYGDLNANDAIVLLKAMTDNSQIYGIATDTDVKAFYEKLYERFYFDTTTDLDAALKEVAPYFDSIIPF